MQIKVPGKLFKTKEGVSTESLPDIEILANVKGYIESGSTTNPVSNCGLGFIKKVRLDLVIQSFNRDIYLQAIDARPINCVDIAKKYILENKELLSALYQEFIEKLDTSVYALSDIINRGTKACTVDLYGPINTERFVNWLIKNNVGTVFQSPLCLNKYHKSPGNLSIFRVWLWAPPQCNFMMFSDGNEGICAGKERKGLNPDPTTEFTTSSIDDITDNMNFFPNFLSKKALKEALLDRELILNKK